MAKKLEVITTELPVPKQFGIFMCPKTRILPTDEQVKCDLCEGDCFKQQATFRSIQDFEAGRAADLSNYRLKLVCEKCVLLIIANFIHATDAMADIHKRMNMLVKGEDGKLHFNIN